MVCGDVVRSDTAGLHIRADQPQPIALFHQMSEAARRSLPVSVSIPCDCPRSIPMNVCAYVSRMLNPLCYARKPAWLLGVQSRPQRNV